MSVLMPVDDYLALDSSSEDYIRQMVSAPGVFECGFIEWLEDEAPSWGGPWQGDRVLAVLEDMGGQPAWKLQPASVFRAMYSHRISYNVKNFPHRLRHRIDLRYDTQALQAEMDPAEHAKWAACVAKATEEAEAELRGDVHLECPVRTRLCGNDDCSYSRVYADREAALAELQLLLAVPTFDAIRSMGFVFTN